MNREVASRINCWYKESLGGESGLARAAKARLRRCQHPLEALMVEETHRLYEDLKISGNIPNSDQVALIAIIFACLSDIRAEKPIASLFGKKILDSRLLSNIRFQTMIRSRSHRELIMPLRRAIAILGPNPGCNGLELAKDLYFWGEKVRQRWCFQYFGTDLNQSTH